MPNWKRNYRDVPPAIREKIAALGDQPFRIGCVRKVTQAEVVEHFSHLGLAIVADQLVVVPAVLPPAESGKFSKRNVEGREVIRKDLPKIPKEICLGDRPIYGDWSNGSFELWVTKMVYQRDQEPALNLRIRIRLLDTEDIAERKYLLVFEVDRELQVGGDNFEIDLFFDLNLLQENVGATDVIATNLTNDDLLQRIYVNWQLLPPGHREATLAQILNVAKPQTPEVEQRLQERYELLADYQPSQWIVGTGGFHGYFGAVFTERVVLENIQYGNAAYIFTPENWAALSQLSRTELMHGHAGEFERIVHRAGWENTVRERLGA